MGHKHSIADPYMYFSRNKTRELAIWLSWVEENLIAGLLHIMTVEGEKSAKEVEVEDVAKLKAFVGCKVEIDKSERSAEFTQPVMIQLFLDEFGVEKKKQVSPAEPNAMLKSQNLT